MIESLDVLDAQQHITPWHTCSIGHWTNNPASAVWPVANLAIYVPFRISRPILIKKVFWYNGVTLGADVDVGVYDEYGTRIISGGATAQSGISLTQSVDVTDIVIGRGLFYLAISLNNTIGTIIRTAPSIQGLRSLGCAEQVTAHPLPAVATFAPIANSYIPTVGIVRELVAT